MDETGAEVLVGLVLIGLAALLIAVWWRIFAKTGHSGWMGILMLVPFVNLIMLLVLAFGEWPIHRELRELRERGGGAIGP